MVDTRVKTKNIIDTLAHQGYTFGLNVLDDRIYVNGDPISDLKWSEIRAQARDRGIRNTQQVMDAVIWEATKHPFHPIKDWLSGHMGGQMGWDGKPYIQELAGYFTDSDGVFQSVLERWLIGAVEKVFTDGQSQNPVLVLDGKQNLGKSYFVKWLAAGIYKYFIEESINPNNKDHELYLITKFIWEVMELGTTIRRQDYEDLKRFITMGQVTVRKPYGRESMIKPAMASFIGTINDSTGFLVDPTGHRRYRPCHIETIDWSYANKIYQGNIWAEAYARYLMGETSNLSPAEQTLLKPVYERYEVVDPMVECLLKYFHVDPNDQINWMSSFDILYHLEKNELLKVNSAGRRDSMYLKTATVKLGLRKTRVGNLNGYNGIRVKP